jgi:membrane protease YdiL (CAAX protease family)
MEQQNENRLGINEKSGLFILIGLMGVGFVVGGFVSITAWKLMTGQDMAQMQVSMTDPGFSNQVRVTQTLLSMCIFLFPALIAARMVDKQPLSYIGLTQKSSALTFVFAIILMLLTIVIGGSLATVNEMIPVTAQMELYFKTMEEDYMKQVEVMSQMKGIGDFLIALLVMAFVPAVVEEVFFRGGFQNMMHRSTGNFWVAIIVTSLLFSAIHFSFYGFLTRTALSIVLGLLYAYTRNLWMPILAHFINNAIGVGEVYYLRSNGQSLSDGIGDKFPIWWGILALVAFIFIFKQFQKQLPDGPR